MAFGTNAIKRTTILSLMDKAIAAQEATTVSEAFDVAVDALEGFEDLGIMVDDEETGGGRGNSRSGGRSGGSRKRGSGSRSSSRGKGRGRGGGNDSWKDDPATDAQIDKAIDVGALEDGYSEDELADMT